MPLLLQSAVVAILLAGNALAQSAPPDSARTPALITRPSQVIELNPKGNWKASPSVAFASDGRVLVLYRDRWKADARGNWHLVRVSDLWAHPKAEEIVFAPQEEPSDPDRSRTWEGFGTSLHVTEGGTTAYAVFGGGVNTTRVLPPKFPGVRNVNFRSFINVVAFDLDRFVVTAKRDVTEIADGAGDLTTTEKNSLLLAKTNNGSWQVHILDASLKEIPTSQVQGRRDMKLAGTCQLIPDSSLVCADKDGAYLLTASGNQPLLRIESPWHVHQVKWSTAGGLAGVFALDSNRAVTSDRLWKLSAAGVPLKSSGDFSPHCPGGWRLSSVSNDGNIAAIECTVIDDYFDDAIQIVKWSEMQIYETGSMRLIARWSLSTRRISRIAIWHRLHESIVAVLEDADILKLYRFADDVPIN